MQGSAGRVTLGVGAAVAVAVLAAGRTGVPEGFGPVLRVLPELLGVLAAALAARFGKARGVGAALLLAGLSPAARLGWLAGPAAAGAAVGVPVAVALLAAAPEVGIAGGAGLALAVGPAAAAAASAASAGARWAGEAVAVVLAAEPTQWAALMGGVAVAALAYAVRRGALDAALLWAVALASRAPLLPAAAGQAALAGAELVLLAALAEEAYRLAYHDGLTGLPSRRALEEALARLAPPFAVAMVDVDRFKRFNDRYGHDAGDQALRMVARELAGGVRGGRAFRYGGEEFAVLFPGRGAREAAEVMDAVRRAIAARPFALRAPDRPRRRPARPARRGARATTRVTVSVGVAGSSRHRSRPEDVLAAAARALYRAKAAGRNRVVTAPR